VYLFFSKARRTRFRLGWRAIFIIIVQTYATPVCAATFNDDWIVEIDPIVARYIELPALTQYGSVRWFGENFQTKIIRKLIQKKIRVRVAEPNKADVDELPPIAKNVLRTRVEIAELKFIVGRRGERMQFGFARGEGNDFNHGLDVNFRNEFPLTREPGWFGPTFRDTGGLRTGLEIGHEINFEVVLAGARVKRLPYAAHFGTDLVFSTDKGVVEQAINARTSGFYFDVSAHFGYGGADYLAALTWARTDALLRAFDRAVDATVNAIAQNLLAAQQGTIKEKTVAGIVPSSSTKTPISIDAGSRDIKMSQPVAKYRDGFWRKLWLSIKGTATLPYRIWRYYQYDQDYRGADSGRIELKRASSVVLKDRNRFWAHHRLRLPEAWARHGVGDRRVIVAVLDSGMDYNHSELNRTLYWDGLRESAGWDFISGDARAFDDHAHGTEVASIVGGGWSKSMGVAPGVTLLPVKVFSPYGQTSSGSIVAAFEYAIASGARIIVCGWATPVRSAALRSAIEVAKAAGVLVVAAAGDDGTNLDDEPRYPAAYSREFDNVVSVAAYGLRSIPKTNISEVVLWRSKNQKIASSYGPRTVDLAAPGEDLFVARPRGKTRTQSHSGLAAGVVAGVAALATSVCPTVSASELKVALLDDASPSEPDLDWQVSGARALLDLRFLNRLAGACKKGK